MIRVRISQIQKEFKEVQIKQKVSSLDQFGLGRIIENEMQFGEKIYENKSVEYTLEQVFNEGYKLNFYDIEFERVDKVGENDSYFAIFFLSARNERVSTLSIKNYYIIDKNKNEIYKTSEKDIIKKGIILEDVDIFVKKKGIIVYD